MKILARSLIVLMSALWLSAPSAATITQAGKLAPEEIVRRAASNEEKIKAAQNDFYYRQEILVQVLGDNKSVREQLHRVSEMTVDDLGNRTEKIISYPPSRLTTALGVIKVDYDNLLGVGPFFLLPQSLSAYSIKLVERQKIDDLDVFLFQVEPADQKSLAKPKERGEHLFSGKVWIDEQDLQVVKVEGRAAVAKDEKSRFSRFECYRENVEGNMWMPSMVYAEDVLEYPKYDIPIKIMIKYTGYKKTKGRR